MSIPMPPGTIEKFVVMLKNPAGERVPLDVADLEREYRQKRTIVVPKVTPGSEIAVYIAVTTHFVLPSYEYYFRRDIPIAVSTFTFSEYDKFEYDFKTYNYTAPVDVRTVKTKDGQRSYQYHTYQLKDVLPRSNIDFQGSVESSEIKVALALRSAFDEPTVSTWEQLANGFAKTFFRICYARDDDKLSELTASVKRATSDMFSAADSLLRMMQAFNLCDEADECRCNFNEMLLSRKGSIWGITALLRKFYLTLGLDVEVLVTRSRDNGGYDPDFVTSASLELPLLLVTVDSTRYLAFPFNRGGKLGEYSHGLENMYGLSLSRKKPVLLPPSTTGPARSSMKYLIINGDKGLSQKVDFRLYGSLAYDARIYLRDVEPEKRKEFYQRWLTALGTANALETCEITGFDNPGTPVNALITFSNADQFISRGSTRQIRFSNLFERYFESYDTFRVEEVVIAQSLDDTVEIQMPVGTGTAKPDFKCTSCTNNLFSVTCEQHRSRDTLFFRRIVHVDTGSFNSVEMKELYPDILNLNRTGESSVTLSRKKRRR